MNIMNIGLLNGPNLNMLGKREPHIYGATTLDEIVKKLENIAKPHNIISFQSNIEGELVDFLQKASENNIEYIIFNAAAYSHYSIAIRDAISLSSAKVIEVHISNIYTREEFRHNSIISPVCVGVISGFGVDSYFMAMNYILSKFKS